MKILLLGGTGAIGKGLIGILPKDIEIYVTSRKEIKSSENINYIKGNAHDIQFIKKVILDDTFDVIVDFMTYEYSEFEERISLFLNNTTQYFFLSSSRVYSELDKTISERTERLLDVCDDRKYLNTHEYALEKAREENLLIKSKSKNWTIIRPYITYNDNRLQLGIYEKEQWLYRVLKGKKIAIQTNLLNKITTLSYANDVSKYISKLMLNKNAYGEIFQIADNMSDVTWKDIVGIYKNELNKKNIKMNIELIETEKYDKLFNYYQLRYDRYYNRIFNSNKLENAIQEKTYYTNVNKGLSDCLSSFLKNVDLEKIELDPKFNGIMDRILKEQTSLKEFKSLKSKVKYIIARYTCCYDIKSLFRYL